MTYSFAVSNIGDASKDDLKNAFGGVEKVLSISKGAGFAMIEFENQKSAEIAISETISNSENKFDIEFDLIPEVSPCIETKSSNTDNDDRIVKNK